MSGIFSSVINQGSTFGIQTATVRPNPVDGLAYQLYFDAGGEYISVGDGKVWRNVKGSIDTYNFGSGLRQLGSNVTNNLTTGQIGGQTIIGTPNDEDGVLLTLKAQDGAPTGQDNVAIRFYSDDAGKDTYYFQSFGAWNFGGNSNPLLTTPYQYVFQNRGVFNARWDFNANIALLNTTGSHIQSAWQTNAPTGNANQTHLFFDSVGSPSFRIGTNHWFKFTPNTLTATRNYALQDSNYTLAGLDIVQTFSALQTFSAGATFGAAINATAGSAATTSINFGTANTGIYASSSQRIDFATSGVSRMYIDTTNGIVCQLGISANGGISMGSQLTSYSTATIRGGANSPEGVYSANVGSLFLRTNGGANTTLYVKESGTGNTGWVAK